MHEDPRRLASSRRAPSKKDVVRAVIERLQRDLAALTSSQQETQAGATHEEARPESDKDTRATESSYLARGLAKRVAEVREALSMLEQLPLRPFGEDHAAALGALVTLAGPGDEREFVVLIPRGGGLRVQVAGVQVTTVTPSAPLGRALMGIFCDDDMAVDTPSGLIERIVVGIS